jgi:hypothetical protein
MQAYFSLRKSTMYMILQLLFYMISLSPYSTKCVLFVLLSTSHFIDYQVSSYLVQDKVWHGKKFVDSASGNM